MMQTLNFNLTTAMQSRPLGRCKSLCVSDWHAQVKGAYKQKGATDDMDTWLSMFEVYVGMFLAPYT